MNKLLFFIFLIMMYSQVVSTVVNEWGYYSRYYNISKQIKSDTGIVVIAYNRPDYFQQVVDTLEKNPESQTLPFFFVLDGGLNATQKENVHIILKSKIKYKEIIKRKINYGCGKNILDARRFMFEWCGFDRIILFEDDLVVSPEYISLTLNLHSWAKKNYDNVGVVQCFNNRLLSYEQKKEQLDVVEETYGNFWGYCLDKDTYNDIKDLLNEYDKKYLNIVLSHEPNCIDIANWMKWNLDKRPVVHKKRQFKSIMDYENIFNLRVQSLLKRKNERRYGQDIEMRFALYKAGYIKITTKVNRAVYIGKSGFHHDSANWNKHGFDKIILDKFSDDTQRDNFISTHGLPDRLRVLFVIDYFSSLLRHYIGNQLQSLITDGHKVTILTSMNVVPSLKGYTSRYKLPKIVYELSPDMQNEFDVVCCPIYHDMKKCFELKEKYNIGGKFVISFPVLKIDKKSSDLDKLFMIGDLFLTTCFYHKDKIIKLGCDPKKVKVLYPPLNLSKFFFKGRKINPKKALNMITVSSFEKNSGIIDVLYAIAYLKTKYKNIQYFIVGDGPEKSHIKRLIKNLKITDNIKIINMRNMKKLPKFFDKSHIFILPNISYKTYKYEGIPENLKNAMSCGLLVVSTDIIGISELVEDKISGFLISNKNAGKLIDKFRYIITHAHNWKKIIERGRKNIDHLFNSWTSNAKFVNILQDVAGNKQS